MAKPKEQPRISPIAELGSTGLKRYGGWVQEEFLRELAGTRGAETYREMKDNDAMCGAVLFAIEMLLRNVTWRVEAFGDEQEDQWAKEFVEQNLDDMNQPWADTIAEVLSMLPFGWAWHEQVYKLRMGEHQESASLRSRYNDGLFGWRKISIRAQETLWQWEFDDNGGIRAMLQMAPPDFRVRRIPIEKSLLFRTTTVKGNPEGRSVLRNAYRAWYIKKHIENVEAIGIERDLTGLPVIWVPPHLLDGNATAGDKAALAEYKRLITNIKRDEQEGVVMPLAYDHNNNKAYDLTLLSTGGRRQIETTEIIGRWDQRIAMTVLADFILLGHEKVGSFSLNSSKTTLFATALGAWLTNIKEVFNRFAIPRLFQLNGKRLRGYPTLAHGDVEKVDLAELGAFISNLAGAGVNLFPDDELEKHLKQAAGLPVKETDDQLLPRRQQTQVDPKLIGAGVRAGVAAAGVEVPEEEAVQDTALNGAQVTSMREMAADVAAGVLPAKSVKAMMRAAFPAVSTLLVDEIVDPIIPGSAAPRPQVTP